MPEWGPLYKIAEETLDQLIPTLPVPIREEAEKIPVLLENWPPEDMPEDTLGLYEGFEEGYVAEAPGPIRLFLGTIEEYCREEELDFAEEIRRTFLHELGHHLGWDEDELEKRGLD